MKQETFTRDKVIEMLMGVFNVINEHPEFSTIKSEKVHICESYWSNSRV